jgi:hypothetical protein
VQEHFADGEPEIGLCHGPVDHQPVAGGEGSHVHEIGGIAVVVLHPVFGKDGIPDGLPRFVVAHGTVGACGHHYGDPRGGNAQPLQLLQQGRKHLGRGG